MDKKKIALGALLAGAISVSAFATYNATAAGTVNFITQMGPGLQYSAETFVFQISNQPATTCSSGYSQFLISPGSIPDAQTRRNMLAVLMQAKASGARVQVAYDNTNGYCDQGSPAVYYISLL
jgi:hypothetical protein